MNPLTYLLTYFTVKRTYRRWEMVAETEWVVFSSDNDDERLGLPDFLRLVIRGCFSAWGVMSALFRRVGSALGEVNGRQEVSAKLSLWRVDVIRAGGVCLTNCLTMRCGDVCCSVRKHVRWHLLAYVYWSPPYGTVACWRSFRML